MKFMNFFTRASKSQDPKSEIQGRDIEGFKEKQENMKFESLELSALFESNEEGEKNREVGSRRFCIFEEDSWQILVAQPMKEEENKPFCEVLSFWKQKEKEDT